MVIVVFQNSGNNYYKNYENTQNTNLISNPKSPITEGEQSITCQQMVK